MTRHILSLFDASGVWSDPYLQAGYEVTRVDLSLENDIRTFEPPKSVWGVLAAPPCTHFTNAASRYWVEKDADGRTQQDIVLVLHVLLLVAQLNPQWWVLENPPGRLPTLVPYLTSFGPRYFQPWHYGDPWTKRTGLWGNFTMPPQSHFTPPESMGVLSTPMQNAVGKATAATKAYRATTPSGFANAFFRANP